jgi:hypothetical protein
MIRMSMSENPNLSQFKEFFRRSRIIKNEQKIWVAIGRKYRWNQIYKESILKYLNSLDPLFEKAKVTSEFEFICTLLRVEGIKSAGWDPWENTIDVFDNIYRLASEIKDYKKQTYLSLWLYGHIIEASQPYDLVANLINIIAGQRYHMQNFPDIVGKNKYSRPQTPSEKIRLLAEKAKFIAMPDSINPFDDVFDRELRNAIFHSDYSLFGDELRLTGAKLGVKKIYSHDELSGLFNKALAYFEAFKTLMSLYINSYQEPKIIPIHPGFSNDPEEKAITIVRKNHGLAGLKDNWTTDQIKKGKITFRFGRFLGYETNMLDKNTTLAVLPENRIKKINRVLKLLPNFLRKKIIGFVKKRKWV